MESGMIMARLSTHKKRTKEIEFAIFLALGSFKVLEAIKKHDLGLSESSW